MATINNKERVVMRSIYNLTKDKDSRLLDADIIYEYIKPKKYLKLFHKNNNWDEAKAGKLFVSDKPIKKEQIRDILHVLAYGGYFELTQAIDGEKEVFVVDVLDRGKNFARDERDRLKGIYIKIGSTIAFAILSFTVTMILRAIFG